MDKETIIIDGAVLLLMILGLERIKNPSGRLNYSAIATKPRKGRLLERMMPLWEKWLKNRKRKAVEKEIYEGVSFLRNLLTLDSGRNIQADLVIQQLAHRDGVLKPVYSKMLGLLRLNRPREAIAAFHQESGADPGSREFASLLVKWDEIDPEELSEIMISIQKASREKRVTQQKRADEVISDLIYLPVILNVMVIFLNFLVVSFFLEQKEMLSVLL